ncbi:hypothetical protein MTsPCn9_14850 [Croceitalea sp. MTPC9]|uniref:hypothetical protein n=1 Tax=unclassified Croceitalea TaxID=2632280 RepID=UPI002B3774C6|nr:hypothetical protein MTsPCn6_14280 [Croceitalea sp. MTPC6]GMN16549.1 hypothetical protein MTsPCn9_14850 [Croceitalea sp. MTPC9]
MNSFEEIQSKWNEQAKIRPPKDGFESLMKEIEKIKNKQKITNVVLFATVLVLVGFFFYISGYNNRQVILGLSLMIGSLIVRIIIELLSIKKLQRINRSKENTLFKQELTKYYNQRRIVHIVITPLIVLLYAIGFIILLPLFKANLSAGFYTYILISSIVLLVVFGFFIGRQLKNELADLRFLKDSD